MPIEINAELVGREFKVSKPATRLFPRDFEVTDVTMMSVICTNAVETYTVSREAFANSYGKAFVDA